MHSEADKQVYDSDKKNSMETLDTQNSNGKMIDSPELVSLKKTKNIQTPTPIINENLNVNSKNLE